MAKASLSTPHSHGAFGFCVAARRSHAHHRRRPPESGSDTLVVHLHLKARSHTHMFGTGLWSVAASCLGVRAWAGGRAHVASLEGRQCGHVHDYCVHEINSVMFVAHERSRDSDWTAVRDSLESRVLESRSKI